MKHHYVAGADARVIEERFCGDPVVSFLYSRTREDAGWLFRALTSARLTDLLAMLRFDLRPVNPAWMRRRLARATGIDFSECADPVPSLDTPRKCFERRIRYWDCRPMDADPGVIVSPADARTLVGSLDHRSGVCVKRKFFDLDELIGAAKSSWIRHFRRADVAISRLTPDRYHYTHTPVAGMVRDVYEIDGRFQSCHPAVVVVQATPFSKNRRTVTLIDTDVPGGSQVGMVAMIEIVALMIGDVHSCYSARHYENPVAVTAGMLVDRGCPKGLFRPGSSTVVLLFERGRIEFDARLTLNGDRADIDSHYSLAWGHPLAETDLRVRETLARVKPATNPPGLAPPIPSGQTATALCMP